MAKPKLNFRTIIRAAPLKPFGIGDWLIADHYFRTIIRAAPLKRAQRRRGHLELQHFRTIIRAAPLKPATGCGNALDEELISARSSVRPH